MKTLINKLILIIISLLFIFSFISKNKIHPYHIGNIDAIYQNSTKKFELSCRFFIDDTEMLLKNEFKKNINIEANSDANDEYMKAYFLKNIKIKNNYRNLTLNYIGYEIQNESVVIYLESNVCQVPKKVELFVSVLHQIFKDQINIVHIKFAEKSKSTKLNYPESVFKVDF